jgi:hypothetical protein
MFADCEGMGVKGGTLLRRGFTCVDANIAEIGAEPRLEECPRCLRQRSAASSQGLDVRRGR